MKEYFLYAVLSNLVGLSSGVPFTGGPSSHEETKHDRWQHFSGDPAALSAKEIISPGLPPSPGKKDVFESLQNVTTGTSTRGEYEPIGAFIISRGICPSHLHELTEIHAHLIDSAQDQNITVLIKIPKGNKTACIDDIQPHLKNTFSVYSVVDWIEVDDAGKGLDVWARDYTPNWFDQQSDPGNNTVVSNLAWGKEYNERTVAYEYVANSTCFTQGPLVKTNLVWEGGNFMADSRGLCISSKRVLVANDLTEDEGKLIYHNLFGCKHSIFLEMLPWDATKHIDIFVSFARDGVILFGHADAADELTTRVLRQNHLILTNDTFIMDKGYEIVPVPMPKPCRNGKDDIEACVNEFETKCPFEEIAAFDEECSLTHLSGCNYHTIERHRKCLKEANLTSHRSYINMFHLNDQVHVPVFSESNEYEADAIEAIRTATQKEVIKHNADLMASLAGEIHCVTKELPQSVIREYSYGSK